MLEFTYCGMYFTQAGRAYLSRQPPRYAVDRNLGEYLMRFLSPRAFPGIVLIAG